jgi:threonine dehydratase
VDEWTLVSEPDIATAIRLGIDQEHQLIEGSAGVALAAARDLAGRFPGGIIVVVLCGGNIAADTLKEIL